VKVSFSFPCNHFWLCAARLHERDKNWTVRSAIQLGTSSSQNYLTKCHHISVSDLFYYDYEILL
jgi:hypothetical protein